MLVTTTPTIEGGRITRYYGIVSGETIIGANVFRDFFASIRDVVGGRSGIGWITKTARAIAWRLSCLQVDTLIQRARSWNQHKFKDFLRISLTSSA